MKPLPATLPHTASIAGIIADPGMASYVAAKHGVIGLTKATAIDYRTREACAAGLLVPQMGIDDLEARGW